MCVNVKNNDMPRPRLTEEERKRRRSERYKKWWENKKAADPDFLKRRAAQQLQRYHFKIENEPGFKESERERSILRYANRTPEQKERDRAAKRQYHRDCRASFKKMGIPYLTEDEKRRKAEKQRMRYANDPEYRKRVRQQQKDCRRRKKERLEEEAYQRRLAMSRDARNILNY